MANLTLGFIGYGNMAQAIAQGLVASGQLAGDHIVACAAHYDKLLHTVQELGARALHSAQEVVEAADMVVVAVKPYQIEQVLAPVKATVAQPGKMLLSIAAGWTLDQYQELLGEQASIQCVIPNTPIAVGQGVLVTETANSYSEEQRLLFESLFAPISLIERVDSQYMGIGSSVAGCGPAFAEIFLEALGDAGVKYGLQRQTAYRLAAKMIEGVGALYMETGAHPGALKDAVCSPGGTTIRGVSALEMAGFRGAVISAVDAIQE
ncbi:pyrroline-5-carboxylate reductase [Bifidobacterium aemilianum]|uniref:Pyrroline-5-carboxylate reductase n=1 Tax=Bifidobacterium aemilianum TaxID=2493120 RepID=A0A366KC99_9BIFI|nr:pyrroline-5-carboxylate reductase [Bifidobacterium aemilianum]RBP98281.1 pyrroline-5-carboxylate reductase [Bifidobacterium aemilianum]